MQPVVEGHTIITMRALALITARGGSKGLLGKNLRPVGGVTLVGRAVTTVTTASKSWPDGLDVFLSTDSTEIAAAVPPECRPHRLRPASLASDTATSMEVVLYELRMARQEGNDYSAVLLLQPTSPLVSAEDLLALLRILSSKEAESALLVTENEHPVEWLYRLDEANRVVPLFPEAAPTRRQDTIRTYRPLGVEAATSAFIDRTGALSVSHESRAVPIPAERAVDIDSALDLAFCELLLRGAEPSV